jgi:hypothetical protein
MFDDRGNFKTDEAYELYEYACAQAHAPGSCVFGLLEAHMCTYRAIGLLIMAQEIEPMNPHIAWMLAWITNFDCHGTDRIIELMNKTYSTIYNAKQSGEYPSMNIDGCLKAIGYGLKAFTMDRNNGKLMTK